MSYKISVIKKSKVVKVVDVDMPPTSKDLDKLLEEFPESTFDICRVELKEDDFDYRLENDS